MRIAMFTETWYPTRDGVVTSITEFRKGLEKLGHEVFIFAAGSRAARKANTDPHVRLYTGPVFRAYPDYHIATDLGPKVNLMRSLGIDVVHTHGTAMMGLKAVRVARLAKLPLVLTYHTRVEDATGYITKKVAREKVLRTLIWQWHRWYFRQCDAIVCPTDAVKDDILRQLRREMRRAYVIPTGVDTERFLSGDREAARAKYNLDGRKVVLTVGRVAWEKNVETLLAAAEVLLKERDDLSFMVAGKGPALAHFKAEADKRGLSEHLRFLGFVPDDELPSLYQAADAFLMPSTFETQGIALLEAMAAGLPVAAADTGGPTHFVRAEENGFLFEGRSVDSCVEAVRSAIGAGASVRVKARETAGSYSLAQQTRANVKAYTELIEARAAS